MPRTGHPRNEIGGATLGQNPQICKFGVIFLSKMRTASKYTLSGRAFNKIYSLENVLEVLPIPLPFEGRREVVFP